MLAPTHLAGSYLAVSAALNALGCREEPTRTRLLLLGLAAGVLPDLDLLFIVWHEGTQVLGDQVGVHHRLVTHTPIFFLAGSAAFLLLPKHFNPTGLASAVVILVGGLSHLVLDSFVIGWGVMWFYPLSSRMYGFLITSESAPDVRGNDWLWHYLRHPLISIEASIVVAALAAYWLRRRRASTRSSVPGRRLGHRSDCDGG